MNDNLSFIPLGGVATVTRNMYLYTYKNEILIVDCGLGFPDETMLGVDLLLPDISHLLSELKSGKKIAGMVLTHGHEDHIGALPFILPQLPDNFPIHATNLTAGFANEKLKEFRIGPRVQKTDFNKPFSLGSFTPMFIRVTHSIPDTSHIFIRTPVGNLYHGSDFKFDKTPYDGKVSDIRMIEQVGKEGVMCLMSDSLGAERRGVTGSEIGLTGRFEEEMKKTRGKFIVTTFSSHVARLNQVIEASEKNGRKVCFVGRSLLRAKDTAQRLGYLKMRKDTEIDVRNIKNYRDRDLTLIIAGSQGQEESAMTRAANDEHREIKLKSADTVIFSSDPIPGYELFVYEVIDTIAKKDIRVLYSPISHDFHVSGHGSADELAQLIRLLKPKKVLPISGQYRHMYAYKNLAMSLGYKRQDVLLLEAGQEILFSKNGAIFGKTIPLKNVYVDEVSGEELESFVLVDRQKLSQSGIVIVLAQISASSGEFIQDPDIIIRGFAVTDSKKLNAKIINDLKNAIKRKGKITNWQHIKKLVGDITERRIFRELHHTPLVLPVVIEV